MKFSCGLTHREKMDRSHASLLPRTMPRKWFAWRPVTLDEPVGGQYQCVWLCYVLRAGALRPAVIGSHWVIDWKYFSL